MKILIDGYNLIFQCGLQGRSTGPNALEKSRQRLLRELTTKLPESLRKQLTIVFDAAHRPVKEVPDATEFEGIQVLFAVGHEDADSLIEELIRKHSSPKQLTVVSSDHRLHVAARRRKATAIDSDVWFDSLEGNSLASDEEDSSGVEKPFEEPGHFNPFPPGYGEDLASE